MPKIITLDYIKEFSLKDGTNCISDVYIDNYDLLKFVCPKGHHYEMAWSNFKQNHRCKFCSGLNKKTIDYIKEFSIKNNTICINKEYNNAHEKLTFICSKGHKYLKSWNKFKSGQRCSKCYKENKFGDNNPNYNPDRTRRLRCGYLQLDSRKLYILKDDPNYENYIKSKKDAKESNIVWDRTNYQVDHIFPRVAFIDNDLDIKYNKCTIKEICNSRENLRILKSEENRDKWNKYNQDEFLEWFNKKLLEQEIINV